MYGQATIYKFMKSFQATGSISDSKKTCRVQVKNVSTQHNCDSQILKHRL